MASDSAPETPVEEGPRLIPLGSHVGKPPMPLTRLATVIGAHKRSHLQLASSSISKHHAVVVVGDDECYISDLASRTKVKINGTVARDGRLHDGDEIVLGKFLLRFAIPTKGPPSEIPELPPTVIADQSGLSHPLDDRVLLIGSRAGCDVVIEEAAVSGRHAIFFRANGKRYVRDLGSRTGTYINGTRVRQQEVKLGDQIRIGGTTLHLDLTAPLTAGAADSSAGSVAGADAEQSGTSTPTVFRSADEPVAEAASLEIEPPAIPSPPPAVPFASPSVEELDESTPTIDLSPSALPPIVTSPVPAPVAQAEPEVLIDLTPTGELMKAAPPLPEPPKADEPPAPVAKTAEEAPDVIDLANDPDISGATGPGDTAVLKPAPAAPAIELAPAAKDTVKEPPPSSAEPESTSFKTRELSWPRRGWRVESVPPVPEPGDEAPPVATPLTPPLAAPSIPIPAPSIPVIPPVAIPSIPLPTATSAVPEAAPPAPKRGRPPKGSSSKKGVLNRTTAKRVPPPQSAEETEKKKPSAPAAEIPLPPKTPPAPHKPTLPPYAEPDEATQIAEIDFLNLKLDLKSPQEPAKETPISEEPATSELVAMESAPAAEDRPLIVGEEVSHGSHGETEVFDTTISHDKTTEAEPPIIGLEISLEDFPAPEGKKESPAIAPALEPEALQAKPQKSAKKAILPPAEAPPDITPDLDLELPPMPLDLPPAESEPELAELGDTAFGKAVEALGGESTGPLVEEQPAEISGLEIEPPAPVAEIETPPPVQSAPPLAPTPQKQSPEPAAPMSSLAGTAIFGLGAVNVDHFLGGMPVKLQGTPPPAKAQPFSKTPINFEGSWSQPLRDVGSTDDDAPDPIAHIPRLIPTELPPQCDPAAPAANVPFSSEKLDIGSSSLHLPPQSGKKDPQTMAFDGLAMGPVLEKEVFSEFAVPTTNSDTAFGGKSPEQPVPPPQQADPVFTGSPAKADGPPLDLDKDFAEDDFWNRTDEEDGTAPPPEAKQEDIEPTEEDLNVQPPLPVPMQRKPLAVTVPEAMEKEPDPEPELPIQPAETAVATKEPPKRRGLRWLIPFLMVAMLVSMAAAIAAIHIWVPAQSSVTGTLTYLNFNWVQGTDDGNDFQAQQQRLLDNDQTRTRAQAILQQQRSSIPAGFLGDLTHYMTVARSMSLSSQHTAGLPQTVMTISANGTDESADRYRMTAILAAMIEANASVLDDNRRLREVADHARHETDDAVASLEQLKAQIASLQRTVSEGPQADEFAALTEKKTQLQRARFAAEDALDEDREALAKAQANQPPDNSAAVHTADPQLTQLRQQIDDLSARLKAARSDQALSIVATGTRLLEAIKQFNDEISAATAGDSDSSSPMKPVIDAAADTQVKYRPYLDLLVADSQDFEKQIEDSRRDLEESIQNRQQQTWAADSRLQQMQAALDSAQHRYNASVGEGVTDPKILNPLQKEIDQRTAQVKARQAELALDPTDVKVEDGVNRLIESLRSKIQSELKQIAQTLDPLDKQLAELNNSSTVLSKAQQSQTWQLRRGLAGLDEAGQRYSQAIAQVQIAPSINITDLQQQIDELQARFDHRQMALADELQKSTDPRLQALATAQKKIEADKQTLAQAKADYDAIRIEYDRQAGAREDASAAASKIAELNDQLVKRTAQVDAAVRDRDQKLSQADRLFDIKPLSDADVASISHDPRWNYSLYAVAGLAVFFAMTTFAASHPGLIHSQTNEPTSRSAPMIEAELVGEHELDDRDDHEAAVV